MVFTATPQSFRLAQAFTISRGSRTEARVVTATLTRDGVTGQGECVPYARYGETVEGVAQAIAALPGDLTRAALQDHLPPGAARNAADCALWDWEAKRANRRAWDLAGLPAPGPVVTAYTISLDAPEAMEAQARVNAHRPLLKIKLGAEGDMPRLEAVRRGAPQARLIVDANEGWTPEVYADLAPHLLRLGVALVEQPLPAGQDEALAHMARPLPVCADESVHDRASLAGLGGRYDMVNLKLDKAGGLTEALRMREEARAMGLGLMVGCMVGTSLAMAPAVLLAQGAEVADLDGPLLLAEDRARPLAYDAAGVHPPEAGLWGVIMSRTVYVNGAYLPEEEARVSVFDRGFLMADGVYEVTSVLDGRLVDFAGHMARLRRSLSELDMASPASDDELLAIHRELVARNGIGHGMVYLQVTRGAPADRDFAFPDPATPPTLVIFTQSKPGLIDNPLAATGIAVVSIPDQRWARRDIKTVQLLYPSMGKMMAKARGADDAWMVEDGHVTEGTSNNAWIVKDGVLVTRGLGPEILSGITRAAVLRVAADLQMRVEERPFTLEEALSASEAFVTSATTFVTPVVRLDGQSIGEGVPGPVAARLRAVYIEDARQGAI